MLVASACATVPSDGGTATDGGLVDGAASDGAALDGGAVDLAVHDAPLHDASGTFDARPVMTMAPLA